MNDATLKVKELARRLVAHEASFNRPGRIKAPKTFRVCEKLRGPLSRLTGVGGFRSLLSRALALSGAEVSWLRALHVKADGSLEGMEKSETGPDPHTIAESEVVLVAQVIGLLVTFIGPALTQQLLRDIWPKLDGLDV
jgi:hypothetical protein